MNNSHQWIDRIIAKLFEAEHRRLDRSISELTRKNNAIKRAPHPGFMHRGKRHIPTENYPQYAADRSAHKMLPSLAFELAGEVSVYQQDADVVANDEAAIRQLLYKLLVNCCSMQDVRNSLPDCVVALIPELEPYDRTLVDPCHYIRSDWRAVKLYEKLLPKIEMYSVAKMFY